jgi:hypothetical protein
MTEPGDLEARHAYTRGEVEAYLQAVADQAATYKAAIAEAHARTERAQQLERRIVELERRVGQWLVAAHIEAEPGLGRGSEQVSQIQPVQEFGTGRQSQAPGAGAPPGPGPSPGNHATTLSSDGLPRANREGRPLAWAPSPVPEDLLAQIRGSVSTGAPVGGDGVDRGG